MSTWICDPLRRRRWASLAAASLSVVALTGCLDNGTPAGLASRPDVVALQRVTLGGGAVVVDPLPGYCIDRASLNTNPAAGFALIATCQALTGRSDGPDAEPALISVTVLRGAPGRQPNAAAIARVLDGAVPDSAVDVQGLTIVHVEPTAQNRRITGDTRHWRGAMQVNSRLVALALYAAPGSDLAGPEGRRLLIATGQRIRATSPSPPRVMDRPGAAVAQATGGRAKKTAP